MPLQSWESDARATVPGLIGVLLKEDHAVLTVIYVNVSNSFEAYQLWHFVTLQMDGLVLFRRWATGTYYGVLIQV
jgi:hypothetical protein